MKYSDIVKAMSKIFEELHDANLALCEKLGLDINDPVVTGENEPTDDEGEELPPFDPNRLPEDTRNIMNSISPDDLKAELAQLGESTISESQRINESFGILGTLLSLLGVGGLAWFFMTYLGMSAEKAAETSGKAADANPEAATDGNAKNPSLQEKVKNSRVGKTFSKMGSQVKGGAKSFMNWLGDKFINSETGKKFISDKLTDPNFVKSQIERNPELVQKLIKAHGPTIMDYISKHPEALGGLIGSEEDADAVLNDEENNTSQPQNTQSNGQEQTPQQQTADGTNGNANTGHEQVQPQQTDNVNTQQPQENPDGIVADDNGLNPDIEDGDIPQQADNNPTNQTDVDGETSSEQQPSAEQQTVQPQQSQEGQNAALPENDSVPADTDESVVNEDSESFVNSPEFQRALSDLQKARPDADPEELKQIIMANYSSGKMNAAKDMDKVTQIGALYSGKNYNVMTNSPAYQQLKRRVGRLQAQSKENPLIVMNPKVQAAMKKNADDVLAHFGNVPSDKRPDSGRALDRTARLYAKHTGQDYTSVTNTPQYQAVKQELGNR